MAQPSAPTLLLGAVALLGGIAAWRWLSRDADSDGMLLPRSPPVRQIDPPDLAYADTCTEWMQMTYRERRAFMAQSVEPDLVDSMVGWADMRCAQIASER